MATPSPSLGQPLDPKLIKELPLRKITGPGVVLLAGMIIMGTVFTTLHAVNAFAGIKNEFPTMAAWWAYFIVYAMMSAVYLGISVYHFKENVHKLL